ncbi:MAG: flagellar hook capping FlgD N-terminal domain-containing protein [Bryobacterales bacterium]|nr:flagellar hook capping FlgD N-terminal domain-containing protein [Bryobacterales bacterium]
MIQPLGRILGDASLATRGAQESAQRRNTQSAGESPGSFEEVFTETAATGTDSLASKQTFLTLLVAQIKNQNPLEPADGTEFLSQLAQFSELEQLISIRQELEAIGKNSQPAP